ncbi:diguanylate cyclase domain-containing protein [Hahella sp. HN01]|uniref:diguanylate cyclase domain-containing protein n=1 Tax=Hahella sp. HN01 TaxID=2847262 RepID=UPI001C1F107B|nr:diguanylate cyclase [Hahella sp. HN01]MBU6954481.1 diguanylate cyclase [Hahella sp. HN01]
MSLRLRTLLSLSFAGVVIATTAVVSAIVDYEASHRLQKELDRQFIGAASQLAEDLDRGIYARLRDIINVSSLPTMRHLREGQEEERRNILEALKRTQEYYAWIGFTDENGDVLQATNGLMEGLNVASQSWWLGGEAGPYVGDIRSLRQDAINNPGFTTKLSNFIEIAAPVRNGQGLVIGVLGAYVSWDWASELAANVLRHQSQKFELLVVSQQNRVILGPDSLLALDIHLPDSLRANAIGLIQWPDSERYLTGFADTKGFRSFKGLGWTVVARQQADTALEPIRQLRTVIWRWGAIIAAAFALVGWGIAEQISRPLKSLAASARQIKDGARLIAFRMQQSAPQEIHLLSDALGDMMQQLKSRETALQRQYAELDMLYEGAPIGIVIVDQSMHCLRMNVKLAEWSGLQNTVVHGRTVTELASELLGQFETPLSQTLLSGTPSYNAEAVIGGKANEVERHFLAACLPLFEDEQSGPAGAALLISEMTAQRQAEYFATHDSLTGLANRRFLTAYLFQELAMARRRKRKLALLYLDLDRFKAVNDTYGHDAGDALLKEVAFRLKSICRESDLISRLGGDEFVIVALDHKNLNNSARLAKSVVISLSRPYVLGGVHIHTSPSIGIAIYPDDADDETTLLRYADEAMYEAKKSSPGQYRYYSLIKPGLLEAKGGSDSVA